MKNSNFSRASLHSLTHLAEHLSVVRSEAKVMAEVMERAVTLIEQMVAREKISKRKDDHWQDSSSPESEHRR